MEIPKTFLTSWKENGVKDGPTYSVQQARRDTAPVFVTARTNPFLVAIQKASDFSVCFFSLHAISSVYDIVQQTAVEEVLNAIGTMPSTVAPTVLMVQYLLPVFVSCRTWDRLVFFISRWVADVTCSFHCIMCRTRKRKGACRCWTIVRKPVLCNVSFLFLLDSP